MQYLLYIVQAFQMSFSYKGMQYLLYIVQAFQMSEKE
jgi:hypothetical protein